MSSVAKATAGIHGIDANTKLTSATAKKIKAAGFGFAIRYIPRKAEQAANDLDVAEAKAILQAGLALMVVQHVASEGWVPNQALGADYGTNAAAHAKAVGLPAGTHVWLDLEGVKRGVPSDDIIAYCNAWFAIVGAAGFATGVYVGASCGLTGEQLFHNLKTQHYWKSGSNVPDIPERGYCMKQTIIAGDKVAGIEIDRNLTLMDAFGNAPMWAIETADSGGARAISAMPSSPEAKLMQMASDAGVPGPMKHMIEFRDAKRPSSKPRFWAIVNFDLNSAKKRMFVFDAELDTLKSYLCAHGLGSEGAKDDGFATVFSNVPNSGASSLGMYLCSESYQGKHGYSMRLDGLEPTNSNARARAVVVHCADYVSDEFIKLHGRIGRSLGCFVLEDDLVDEVVDSLKMGSLLLAYKS